jgi:hypothetical protein
MLPAMCITSSRQSQKNNRAHLFHRQKTSTTYAHNDFQIKGVVFHLAHMRAFPSVYAHIRSNIKVKQTLPIIDGGEEEIALPAAAGWGGSRVQHIR